MFPDNNSEWVGGGGAEEARLCQDPETTTLRSPVKLVCSDFEGLNYWHEAKQSPMFSIWQHPHNEAARAEAWPTRNQ